MSCFAACIPNVPPHTCHKLPRPHSRWLFIHCIWMSRIVRCVQAAKQVKTFKTTKRGFSQRKDLIKQSASARNYTHKVSMLSAAAASAVSESCLSEDCSSIQQGNGGNSNTFVHNVRDRQQRCPSSVGSGTAGATGSPASSGCWHFNLALQSSLL